MFRSFAEFRLYFIRKSMFLSLKPTLSEECPGVPMRLDLHVKMPMHLISLVCVVCWGKICQPYAFKFVFCAPSDSDFLFGLFIFF